MAAAAETPLAIVLEDIHWADNATLLALRSLATTRAHVAVLWVLTARTGAGGTAAQETLSVLQRANATFVRLAAMSPSAVADMVCDAVRANADDSLLNLAAKAHGNPFLVSELIGGLGEEGRLNVSGGRAVASGHALPRRLGAGMQQRLDLLSDGAGQVVRVAAVLPDRFSAGLLAAMLNRQPASLMSALAEAVRADLLVEDNEQLRFRHDLLREATRQSMPQSLGRAMERQSASIMLDMGAAPAEVATQLARSAEPGDREAIDPLRQAAQSVGHSDASAAADLSTRALELLPAHHPDHGSLVAETVGLLNRASRYQEAEALGVAALSEVVSPEQEAEIRLRLATLTKHTAQRRVEENRRALQLDDISEVTRARHLGWLAYNLMFQKQGGQQRAVAHEAAAAEHVIRRDIEALPPSRTAVCDQYVGLGKEFTELRPAFFALQFKHGRAHSDMRGVVPERVLDIGWSPHVECAPCRAMARPIDGAAMTWLDESKRIPSSGVVGLGVKGIGPLSPTFSTLTRGIGPRFLVKASIFSTSLMLRASGIGTPAFSAAASSSSPFHSFTASASAWYVPPLGLSSSSACWRKAG